jgi:hypothetical protein
MKKKKDNNQAEDSKKMIKKMVSFKAKSVDSEKYIIYGVFSTENEDWHGEKVEQAGWDLSVFDTNPVILFAHDHYQPAVGMGVDIKVQDEGSFMTGVPNGKMVLAGGIKFAAAEYPFAMTLFKLYEGKFMRAFSAGFYNKKYEIDQENDIIILKENALLEISCVNIPANAEALAYSKGIDTSPIEEVRNQYQDKKRKEWEKALKESEERIEKQIMEKINSENNIRADKANELKKVETPVNQGRTQKGFYSPRAVNKTIRQLLKQKNLMDR